MNGTTIAGIVVMLVGALLTSDFKSMGLGTPGVGILIGGAGFFIAAYGYFGSSGGERQGSGRGKKVRDYSV